MHSLKKYTTSIITTFILSFLFTQSLFPSFVSEKIKNIHPPIKKNSISLLKKDWTLLVYMIADKNLSNQAVNSIKQMTRIGSTNSINIVVQLDKENETNIERFYILNNEVLFLEEIPQTPENIGGTSQSLYKFLEWGIKTFPSNKLALVLWNYGTGIKDPNFMEKFLITHRNAFFIPNAQLKMYDLNNQLNSNLGLIKKIEKNRKKKITPNLENSLTQDDTGASNEFNFKITNQDFKETLEKVSQDFLENKKIDIVCIDSCFMAMIEIAAQIKNSVKILVTSQDIVPPTGYNYENILTPFIKTTLQPDELAKHIVNSFKKEYSTNYAIYTQSALNLDVFEKIEQNIKIITSSIIKIIELEPSYILGTLKYLRNNEKCTVEFSDSDYIDLFHFLKSLINAVNTLKKPKRGFTPSDEYVQNLDMVKQAAQEILDSMQKFVVKNVSCKKRSSSNGISIYFPQKKVAESYRKTTFDIETNWSMVLDAYITSVKQIQEIQIEEPNKEKTSKTSNPSKDKQQPTRSIQVTKQQSSKNNDSKKQPEKPLTSKQKSSKQPAPKQSNIKQNPNKTQATKQQSNKQQKNSANKGKSENKSTKH